MLATARWLQYDVIVYWRYDTGKGWIRYPSRARDASTRAALLFHCIYFPGATLFLCEPLIEWPVDQQVCYELFLGIIKCSFRGHK